ncbi:SigE family RNA polymerase sigma factor [Dactylosporangium salmoneum]|uniref:SigE family RNA polymerase sigma factor n=1 Tax=Dactylosporangium salmoneum TaxID=53361 RepID=A0ABP5SF25_9ACTN
MASTDDEFERFATAVSPSLLKTARLLTGDWHLAQDLLQTTLAKVYARWGRSDTWESPVGYARRVMVNTHCTWYRRMWRHELPHDVLPERHGGTEAMDTVALADALHRALIRLTPRQRAIVVLRYYDDLSVEQTAAVMGCSQGTVLSTTSRALAHLRLTPELGQDNPMERR